MTRVELGIQAVQQRRTLGKAELVANGRVGIIPCENECIMASGNRQHRVFDRRIFFHDVEIHSKLMHGIPQ
ncbi:hypothetical protein D3C87_1568140 [compost metagenome]